LFFGFPSFLPGLFNIKVYHSEFRLSFLEVCSPGLENISAIYIKTIDLIFYVSFTSARIKAKPGQPNHFIAFSNKKFQISVQNLIFLFLQHKLNCSSFGVA